MSKALQGHAGVNEVQRCATEAWHEPQPAATGTLVQRPDGRNKRLINGDRWTSVSDCWMKPPQ